MTPVTILAVAIFLTGSAPQPPPAKNIHLVSANASGNFWRGAAPTAATVDALARSARNARRTCTLIDLRKPANSDDRSGKDRKLSPDQERRSASAAGLRYVNLSALDRGLVRTISDALKQGDVYLHCMYGVNRTGFAMGRYAHATGASVSRTGLGKRDWDQGMRFQRGLKASR